MLYVCFIIVLHYRLIRRVHFINGGVKQALLTTTLRIKEIMNDSCGAIPQTFKVSFHALSDIWSLEQSNWKIVQVVIDIVEMVQMF